VIKKCICVFGIIRQEKELKQIRIARVLRICRTTYSRYETGDIEIPVFYLAKLAKFYGTSVDYLLRPN